jgi:tetratricopeptide (TPR) repeat protein
MKKTLVVSGLLLTTATAFAQNSAILQLQNGTLDKAKTEIDKAIADPKASVKAKTWLVKAQVYQAIANDGTGVYVKLDSTAALTAYESYKKALEVEPNGGKSGKEISEGLKSNQLYSALLRQGVAKFQNKNLPDAIKMMGLAGEVDPKDTLAPLYTGIAAQQLKDTQKAREQFERYMANGGKDVQIIYALASNYREDKDIDKALATLDRGLAILPNNKDLSAERVNILMAANRMDEAIAGMKQLVEKDPKNPQNLLNLGILYDNGSNRVGVDLQKLTDMSKAGNRLKKQLADEKSALDAVTGEIVRLTARAKKEPKNADVKRQLVDVVKMQGERKGNVARLEGEVKVEADKVAAAGDLSKQIADLTAKQNEQKQLAKDYYLRTLEVEPANYDANYNMGVFFYNEAAEMKREVDQMDMAEYGKRGKEVEGRVCGRFQQALPYFEKAKSVKEEDVLNDNLTNLRNVLKQFEEKKIACVQ